MRAQVRIARESDGLTFSLTVEDRHLHERGATRVFVGGPTTLGTDFYTAERRRGIAEALTHGACSDFDVVRMS